MSASLNPSWGEPYDRIDPTPKCHGGLWLDYCEFQAGFYQCKGDLSHRWSHELECFYMYCGTCGTAYPIEKMEKYG